MNKQLVLLYNHPPPDDLSPGSFLLDLHGSYVSTYPHADQLLEILEADKSLLREEFLELVHHVGTRLKGDASLEQMLEMEEGFSYWWCCSLFETAPFKEGFVYEILKLLALKRWIEAQRPQSILLCTSDSRWTRAVSRLCSELNTPFTATQLVPDVFKFPFLTSFQSKSALGSCLHHIFKHLVVSRLPFSKKPVGVKKAVITYFPNFSIENGRFKDKYFEEVSSLLEDSGFSWMLFYVGPTRNYSRAILKLEGVTRSSFQFLDQHLKLSDLPALCRRFFSLHRKFLKIWTIPELLQVDGVDYGAFAESSLRESLCFHLLDLLIRQKQIQGFLDSNPELELLYYLMENQPWEQVLLYEAKKRNIQTGGVIHSTISSLKLNYFQDPRDQKNIQFPDQILANSPNAVEVFLDQGIKPEKIVEIEAQRYLYLFGGSACKKVQNSEPVLLVTTSYDLKETEVLLRFLCEASLVEAGWSRIWIKAHPFKPIDDLILKIENFPDHCVREEPLSELLSQVDACFTTITGSVLVESLQMGVPCLSFYSLEVYPMPVLDSHPNLKIVSNPTQLRQSLEDQSWSQGKEIQDPFFYLDPTFPRWKSVLNQTLESKNSQSSEKPSK